MKTKHFSRKKRQLANLSQQLYQLTTNQFKGHDIKINRIILKIKRLLSELRLVFSRFDLKKALGASFVILGAGMLNETSAQTFNGPTKNPFGLVLKGETYVAIPAFADLDNDGDLDILVGEYYGIFQYYKNTGTNTNPQFAQATTNPFGLDTVYYIGAPTIVDLDDDGDLDVMVGEDYGAFKYFKNVGTKTSPSFARATTNPFGLDSVGDYNFPTFVDLDDDGDFDLLVGLDYGDMAYFENTGTKSNPAYAKKKINPFGLIATKDLAFPAFADLDGDGDLDLLVGEYGGKTAYFKNIGTAKAPKFESPVTNPFGIKSAYEGAVPSFVDLDNDGDMDLFITDAKGDFYYYQNQAKTSGVANFVLDESFKILPNPATTVIKIESNQEYVKVEIKDMMGKTLYSAEDVDLAISISDFAAGVYNVTVYCADGKIATQKFVKQ